MRCAFVIEQAEQKYAAQVVGFPEYVLVGDTLEEMKAEMSWPIALPMEGMRKHGCRIHCR